LYNEQGVYGYSIGDEFNENSIEFIAQDSADSNFKNIENKRFTMFVSEGHIKAMFLSPMSKFENNSLRMYIEENNEIQTAPIIRHGGSGESFLTEYWWTSDSSVVYEVVSQYSAIDTIYHLEIWKYKPGPNEKEFDFTIE